MSRRITVPDEHVALVLSNQLVDEMMTLAMTERAAHLARWRKGRAAAVALNTEPAEGALEAKNLADLWGDFALQLLEAKEA